MYLNLESVVLGCYTVINDVLYHIHTLPGIVQVWRY